WKVAELQRCLSFHETSRKSFFSYKLIGLLYGKMGLSRTLVLFYNHHGTRLKSVKLMCQLLSVASESFGLQTNMAQL
ncbi:hypothetical protein J4Q44_G00172960, partial [Coregonus suidteri]